MKRGNNIQIAEVQSQGVAYILLDFFQLGVAYKSVAYKKSVQFFFRIFNGVEAATRGVL